MHLTPATVWAHWPTLVAESLKTLIWLIQFLPHLASAYLLRIRAQGSRVQTCRYGSKHKRQELDVVLPRARQAQPLYDRQQQQVSDRKSVVVIVHGGAWAFGDRLHFLPFALVLAETANCVCILPNYILYPQGHVEEQLADLNAVLSWICNRHNAEYFAMDTNRITLAGHSSGAHISSLLLVHRAMNSTDTAIATPTTCAGSHRDEHCSSSSGDDGGQLPGHVMTRNRSKPTYSEPIDVAHGWSLSSICSFVGVAGVYDIWPHYLHEASRGVHRLSPMRPCMHSIGNFDRFSPTRLLTSTSLSANADEMMVDWATHLGHIRFMLLHGGKDTVVPPSSSWRFADALEHALKQRPIAPGCKAVGTGFVSCFRLAHAEHSNLVLPLAFRHAQFVRTLCFFRDAVKGYAGPQCCSHGEGRCNHTRTQAMWSSLKRGYGWRFALQHRWLGKGRSRDGGVAVRTSTRPESDADEIDEDRSTGGGVVAELIDMCEQVSSLLNTDEKQNERFIKLGNHCTHRLTNFKRMYTRSMKQSP